MLPLAEVHLVDDGPARTGIRHMLNTEIAVRTIEKSGSPVEFPVPVVLMPAPIVAEHLPPSSRVPVIRLLLCDLGVFV